MSETYRKASRLDWHVAGADENLTTQHLQLGCMQRIADATELMAKRHQELVDAKERAEKSRESWVRAHDSMARRLVAARGQITKLKNALAAAKAGAAA